MHGAQRIHPIWIGFSTYRNGLSESFVELNILPILHLFFGLLMSLKSLTNISAFFVACFMYSYHNNLLPNTFNTIFGTNHQVNTCTGNANNYLLYFCITNIKVSSRVKNHLFSKFSIFSWLSRVQQELSFTKNSRKKCFFCADLWSAKVFSMLISLIDRWQVLSYLMRMPLLNKAYHAIWQKSWSISIVLTVFPSILEVNASKEEKRACPFSSLTPRWKKTAKSFCKVWVSKLAESDKGSYYNQEKWLKDDKASEKPIDTTAKSSFTRQFLSEWSKLFKLRSNQASDKFAIGPTPYKNRTKDFFESLL